MCPCYVWSDSSPALGTYSGLFAISSCATFEGDLTLLGVSPVTGMTASSVVPPHVAFFAQGWTHSGVWEGPPQVLICDLWLRVQPAESFRAGLGGRVPLEEDLKTEFHHNYLFSHGLVLARNHAALVLHSDRTQCGYPSCSPCLRSHGCLLLSSQDGSPAGASPAAPPCAKPRVPGSLRLGPASGHQPLPTDVRGQ